MHRSLKSLGVPMLYNKLCHCTAGFGATAALCCCNELRHRFCSFHSVDQNNYSWRPLPPSPTSTMTPPPQHGSAQSCSQSVPIQRLPGFVQRHSPLIFQQDQHQNCDSCRQSKQPLIGPLYDKVLSWHPNKQQDEPHWRIQPYWQSTWFSCTIHHRQILWIFLKVHTLSETISEESQRIFP